MPSRENRCRFPLFFLAGLAVVGCGDPASQSAVAPGPAAEWAIAIHGGAGTIPEDWPQEVVGEYREALAGALRVGVDVLDAGGAALDAVERTLRVLEDDPRFNAGRGAVFNAEGGHELDASIMDGATRGCGAVTGIRTVRHPISLARAVMERTPHVFLGGAGAEAFADGLDLERVAPEFFDTPRRRESYLEWRDAQRPTGAHGTVGAVALDRAGNLAAGTSTGGLTGKLAGRIGDSPIVGAGTWADNGRCAVSGTGVGEQFIRHTIARSIAFGVERGQSLEQAVREVIDGRLEPGEGGVIAVDARGTIVFHFNTSGMFRGAADSHGRFEVAIWD